MTKTFILLAWISMGHGLSFTAEYSSLEKCEIAGQALVNKWYQLARSSNFVCTEK